MPMIVRASQPLSLCARGSVLQLLLAIATAAATATSTEPLAAAPARPEQILNRTTLNAGTATGAAWADSQPVATEPAAHATRVALSLALAVIRALASRPLPPDAAGGGWQPEAAEVAAALLREGRLAALLAEPTVAAAVGRELRGVHCTVGAPLGGNETTYYLPPAAVAVRARGAQPVTTQKAEDEEPAVRRAAAASGSQPAPVPPPSAPRQGHPEEAAISARPSVAKHSGGRPAAEDGSLSGKPGQLRSRPGAGDCAADGDCPPGQYCDYEKSCYACSYIEAEFCDDISGDCCSAAFRAQCPTNPAKCCQPDGECPGDEVCIADRCAGPSPDGPTLLDAFVRDPRPGNGWATLRGWREGTGPCGGWEGVTCAVIAGTHRVIGVDFNRDRGGFSDLKFELSAAIARLDVLLYFRVRNTAMSGTIPSALGDLSHLERLYLHGNPSLSGSIPSALGDLSQLQTLNLYDNPSLSGSIPSALGGLSELLALFLHGYPSISGSIPSALGDLPQLRTMDLHNNPSLSGSIPSTLGNLSQLQTIYLHNNPSVLGSIPTLQGCGKLQLLDVHGGTLTGLPASLPRSITHLYLQGNPLDVQAVNLSALLRSLPKLHAFDVGFINSHVKLDSGPGSCHESRGLCFGTRVSNPSPCRLRAACAFVLHLYDDYNKPITSGGLIQDLTISLGDRSVPMVDNHDGTFTAAVPTDWIHRTGSYTFWFEHNGEQFHPMMTGDNTVAFAADCSTNAPYGGLCAGLRTIEFQPRDCPAGNHTHPDAESGATCLCLDGYEPDGNSTDSSRSCHRSCHGSFEGVSRDGGSCVCTGETYNSSVHGILLCSRDGWDAALDSSSYKSAKETRSHGGHCLPCPSECIRCEEGVPTVVEGWRPNSTNPSELRSLLDTGTGGETQFVFSCPYGAQDCPEILLSDNRTADVAACPGHHTVVLCASCMDDYSRKGSRDNQCVRCDVAQYIRTAYDLQMGWFVALLCVAVLLVGVVVYMLSPQLKRLKAETKANLRILLGSAQVLSLLPTVLEMVFPPLPRAALSFTALPAADLTILLRFDCWGLSWYDKWLTSVAGVPLLAISAVCVYWLWQRKDVRQMDIDSEGQATAQAEARQSALKAFAFVVFLLYPAVSSSIFSAVRCRQLGEASSWLEVDYSVSCLEARYSRYAAAAYVLIFVMPIGLPLGLLVALVREWRRSSELWEQSDRGEERDSDDLVVWASGFEEYHYSRVQELFGFAVDDYRPGCWWFEPADLLRKLALSGLLQFVHRGTAAQCFMGSLVAFASFGVQQYLRPYREPESNVLKAMVDTQLFLTFLISFILRVLPEIRSSEPFSAEVYGWLLVISMGGLVCAAIALTTRQVRRRATFRKDLLSVDGGMDAVSRVGLGFGSDGAEPPLSHAVE